MATEEGDEPEVFKVGPQCGSPGSGGSHSSDVLTQRVSSTSGRRLSENKIHKDIEEGKQQGISFVSK